MADQDLYSGLIRVHVLYHASKGPVFGLWMIRELNRHGYRVGPGTLYPLLHRMQRRKFLVSALKREDGRIRRFYTITPRGRRALEQAKVKVRELYEEIFEEDHHHHHE